MSVSRGKDSLIQLVQDSFPTVSVVVAKLASETINRSLGQLSGYLCSFAEEIRHLSSDRKRELERDGRIIRALEELERAISWQNAPPSKYGQPLFHSLWEVANAQRMADEGSRDGVKRLEAAAAKMRTSLMRNRVKADFLVATVQSCSDIKAGDEVDEIDMPGVGTEDLPGYAGHAKAVHGILCTYASCSCRNPPKPDHHWARLRLRPVHSFSKEDLIPFEMLFSASPDPSQSGAYDWQGIQILVPTKGKSSKRVQFTTAGPRRDYQTQRAGVDSEPVQGSLCGFISSTSGSILCFKVDGERLMALREVEDLPVGQQITSNPGLDLGGVLRELQMRYGMRPILAYVLAKAVWHYYDSGWMNVGWTKDNIYFMSETGDNNDTTYFLRPYLCARLATSGKNPSEHRSDIGMMHKYPRVLALGRMLTEIAVGQPLSIEGNPDDWNAKTANERLMTLRTMLKNASFKDDCKFPRYKAAVEKCLDPKLFKNAPFNPRNPRENIEKRRAILYDEIVDPLRQLIEGTGWHAEFDEIERTPLVPKDHPQSAVAHAAPVPPGVITAPKLPPASPTDAKWRRDPWLEQIALINHEIVKASKVEKQTSPLRIAVLDTGYDNDAPSFYNPGRLKRMKGWKDFVSRSPAPVDSDGHGTHLVTLLLQVAPSAEIYVARVAENSEGLTGADDNVSQAIHQAAIEWNVDFISMSFGFSRHKDTIRDAISDAINYKKGAVVFFAAAANNGFNGREMFPANLGELVVSMRGTNRSGSFEPDFNPPTSSREAAFGTLGKDVYSDWIGDEGRRCMSGCSVAAPVAVGIASMLLEYAASRREFQPVELRLMRTRRGILELFTEIGVHAGNGRYYLAPFDLFAMSDDLRIIKMKAAIARHPERWY